MNIYDLFNVTGGEGKLQVVGIRVPAIQREYVQGRNNAAGEKARKDFLPRIIDAASLSSGVDARKNLHFVYGLVDAIDSFFMPLDGQQRLTTLFLLAWSNGDVDETWKFEYESRRAATSFIRELTTHPRKRNDVDLHGGLVASICNSDWFMPVWRKDETVAGMLKMLQTIDDYGVNCGDLDLRKIVFEVKIVDASDSSYGQIFLKMNARGKPLTAWENIKAILDANITSEIECKCGFRRIYKDSWKRQIDGDWCEKIWKLCGKDISRLNAVYDRVVRVAFVCVAGGAVNAHGYEIDKWLKNCAESDRESFYDSISAGLASLATSFKKFKSSWHKDRRINLLWGHIDDDKTTPIDEDLSGWVTSSVKENENYSQILRFYFLSLSNKHSGECLRRIRVLLNLLDSTKVKASPSESIGGYHMLAIAGKRFLLDGVSLDELLCFDGNQLSDEKGKWTCDESAVVEIEKLPVIYLGSTKFVPTSLYSDAEELREHVENVCALIRKSELDFYCRILSALKRYDQENHRYRGEIYIPHKDDTLETWGREVLYKTDCARAVSSILLGLEPTNIPLWVQHFRELSMIANSPIGGLRKLRNYGDWMYAVKKTNKTEAAVRLDRTEIDRENRKKLFGVSCFNYGSWRREGRDGKFYCVESDEWISQRPPPAYDANGVKMTNVACGV